MTDKRIGSERAFREACKRNGLIYKKHDKGFETDCVKLEDEDGNSFHLNNDLSVDNCSYKNKDNDLAATSEKKSLKNRIGSKQKKSSYKMQKGLQKA
ncbi:MAG: hypothetical protein GX237_00810 [Clostridiales bacterium]|nr:hypothetical protein [Clostridiales bacterium]